jgi:hypothetical protein
MAQQSPYNGMKKTYILLGAVREQYRLVVSVEPGLAKCTVLREQRAAIEVAAKPY